MPLTKALLFTTLFILFLPVQAQEVYKSTDSEGNVIYSDQPGDASESVTIPEPNVGDAVDVPPPAPPAPVEAEPEVVVEEMPENLQGEIEAVKKRSKKNRRQRKEPRGGR